MESGTTAATAVLFEKGGERNAVVAMVGDSVAYLVSRVSEPPAAAKPQEAATPNGEQPDSSPPPARQDSPASGRAEGAASAAANADAAAGTPEADRAGGVAADPARVPNSILVVNPSPHKPVGTEADRIRCARAPPPLSLARSPRGSHRPLTPSPASPRARLPRPQRRRRPPRVPPGRSAHHARVAEHPPRPERRRHELRRRALPRPGGCPLEVLRGAFWPPGPAREARGARAAIRVGARALNSERGAPPSPRALPPPQLVGTPDLFHIPLQPEARPAPPSRPGFTCGPRALRLLRDSPAAHAPHRTTARAAHVPRALLRRSLGRPHAHRGPVGPPEVDQGADGAGQSSERRGVPRARAACDRPRCVGRAAPLT